MPKIVSQRWTSIMHGHILSAIVTHFIRNGFYFPCSLIQMKLLEKWPWTKSLTIGKKQYDFLNYVVEDFPQESHL